MKYNESKLEEYAEKLSKTEQQQCENAIDMVKDALVDYGYKIKTTRSNFSRESYAYYFELRDNSYNNITILLQGSYANDTNIKRYSDVDISIIKNPIIPIDLNKCFMNFKDDIYKALHRKFGDNVKRKNKSIRVEGNTYRKSIDVVPAFSINSKLEDGIQFLTDKGEKIINYPLKQIFNEDKKHLDTKYMFKKYVRIVKNIRMDMIESNISSSDKIGSFQIESLLWNIPNEVFTKYITLGYGVEEILKYLKEHKYLLDYFWEANGIKKLCNSDKSLFEEFINDLNLYFGYEA